MSSKTIAHKAQAAKGAPGSTSAAHRQHRLRTEGRSISSRATPNRQETRSKSPSNTDPTLYLYPHNRIEIR